MHEIRSFRLLVCLFVSVLVTLPGCNPFSSDSVNPEEQQIPWNALRSTIAIIRAEREDYSSETSGASLIPGGGVRTYTDRETYTYSVIDPDEHSYRTVELEAEDFTTETMAGMYRYWTGTKFANIGLCLFGTPKVTFQSGGGIWMMNPDGSEQRRSDGPGNMLDAPGSAAVSSDDRWVHLVGDLYTYQETNEVRIDGVKLIRRPGVHITDLSWSPDGESVLAVMQGDDEHPVAPSEPGPCICRIGVTDTLVTALIISQSLADLSYEGATIMFSSPHLFTSGAIVQLVYHVSIERGGAIEHYIRIADAGGSDSHSIVNGSTDGPYEIYCPKPSLDGMQIAFLATSSEYPHRTLYVVNSDGTGCTRILVDEVHDFVWIP